MINQLQKRIILSQMGISHWIGHNSPTTEVDVAEVYSQHNNPEHHLAVNQAISPVNQSQEKLPATLDVEYPPVAHDTPDISLAHISTRNPVFPDNNESLVPSYDTDDEYDNSNEIQSSGQTTPVISDIDIMQVMPFNIQAVFFNNWVLLLDTKTLNEGENKLWYSLCSVLFLQPDKLSFPICEGMQSLEVAQATLAGFLYKLRVTSDINVIMLNDCLDVELTSWLKLVAKNCEYITIASMLENPQNKQQLWQMIHC